MGFDLFFFGSVVFFMIFGIFNDLLLKDQVWSLCYYLLSCVICFVCIVYVLFFYVKFEQVYDKVFEILSFEESCFLGFVYVVFVLGCMYKNFDDVIINKIVYKELLDEGYVF